MFVTRERRKDSASVNSVHDPFCFVYLFRGISNVFRHARRILQNHGRMALSPMITGEIEI